MSTLEATIFDTESLVLDSDGVFVLHYTELFRVLNQPLSMTMYENPYEAPSLQCNAFDSLPFENRRPPFGTFLIVVWLLEGSIKIYLVGNLFISGINPFPMIAQEYQQTRLWIFFLVSSLVIFETIGPWVGVYYLTGRRARTFPFETSLKRTLAVSGVTAVALTSALILYCQIAGS